MDNTPWVEKYRPKKFENIILDDFNKEIFKNILEKQYFPNLLFTDRREQEKPQVLLT